MTHDATPERRKQAHAKGNDFIPPIPLSDFVDTQYRSLHRADTSKI